MSLLNQWMRIFWKDNTNYFDLSLNAQDDDNIPFAFESANDYLYIAQDLPFNNLFFQMATANDVQCNVTIETWENKDWKSVVNIIDGTATQTLPSQTTPTPLAKSGVLQFIPDRQEAWRFVDDTTEEKDADFGLQSVLEIYNKYWLRIGFSADLNTSTAIKKIGYAFCNDRQLQAIDPEIDNFLTSWEAGKTDWIEQILIASEHVVADLKSRDMIIHPGQILRLEDVSLATAYRTLALIYSKFGEGYKDQREHAIERYRDLSAIKRYSIDKNRTGIVERGEFQGTVGKLSR